MSDSITSGRQLEKILRYRFGYGATTHILRDKPLLQVSLLYDPNWKPYYELKGMRKDGTFVCLTSRSRVSITRAAWDALQDKPKGRRFAL